MKDLSNFLNQIQVIKSDKHHHDCSNQQICFINIYETSWKLVEYPNFDRLEYGPAQINWAIDLRNDWSAQRQKFVFVSTKKNYSAQPGQVTITGGPEAAAGLMRHGLSIYARESNGMLASHGSSNSRCYHSDSRHLHLLPHVRFFTQGYFFQMHFLKCAFRCSMIYFLHLDGRFSCTSVDDCFGWNWMIGYW